MLKKILLTIVLFHSAVSYAVRGHETGNGGDTHLGRYLLAQHIAEVTIRRVSPSKLREIFVDEQLYKVISEKIKDWPGMISQMKFSVTSKMLYEGGKEKAAISVENSNDVKISEAYFKKYRPSLDEVIINVIHEAGHKVEVRNHQWLDQIGSIFVTKVYKYSDIQDEWLQDLRLDKSTKSGLDARLKSAAYEYLQKGEGLNLACVLYNFTRYHLMNSNLSQVFRYMTQAFLGMNVRTYTPDYEHYPQFWAEVQSRFVKEVVLYVREISADKGLRLIKYGMAKLKVQGLLYTEGPEEFNSLATELYKIMQDKSMDLEKTIVNVVMFVNGKFYLYL